MSDGETSSEAVAERETTFRSLDGLRLQGTFVTPAASSGQIAVLVHGAGVTREEGGFFRRLAAGLADAGVSSLRFDFRAHGASEGRQTELTLSGVANDIRAAVEHAEHELGAEKTTLIAASFGGGLTAMFAANHAAHVDRLVLINPLLNYKKRFIDEKPYWVDDHINEEAGRKLAESGALGHSTTFALSRAVLNEVFYVRPDLAIENVSAPTLFIHGTKDTFIPVDSSRHYVKQMKAEASLLEIEGAQHGIAVHDDPEYADPQTREWQAAAILSIAEWVVTDSRS